MNAPETFTPTRSRKVERLVTGVPTSDGAGVKLTRVLTQPLQRRLDPFLMLDAFGSESASDYIAGFPPHPHRGFETITYMLTGRMRHRDSAGHEGLVEDGGVQWMSAARGVIHSEMPEQNEGRMEGFQLWLNLPGAHKMDAPWYRDIPGAAIPEFVDAGGATVRVIAGESHGVAGAMQRPDTEPLYLDVHLPAGSRFAQRIPAGHNAFVYVYRGEVALGAEQDGVAERRMAILANDPEADGVVVQACRDARLIIVAGKPLGEPIVQYGPFVMNTREEIEATLREFRDGSFEAQAGSLQD
ncbi:pirin family protein [Niveibacterium sp.]|uniref:pirin family protein n=1 Tax=Niveibacterium sp. TaxID=2017444 RepID=UPI0035B0DB42